MGQSVPQKGYIWGSQGGVFAESPDRVYFASRGELKLPERMPPIVPAFGGGEFPGYWGAFGFQAANEPIANMRNIIVVVEIWTGSWSKRGTSGTTSSSSGGDHTRST